MMLIGKVDSVDLRVLSDEQVLDDLEVVSEDLIFEILISATLWAAFLVADSADDLGEKPHKGVKTSKWL